jgi:hypothetical protein
MARPVEVPLQADASPEITANEADSDAANAFWPAPPVVPEVAPASAEETVQAASLVSLVSEAATDEPEVIEISETRERVLALIDELREFVIAIPNNDRDDLRGIIAELEVASTAPGAFDQDELASLRDALLSARDRPRDLDTVLDLTGRIDSLVALVFAYERSHAAIERALAVLRRQ